MTAPAPLMFLWEGDCMRPWPRFQRAADAQFVIGQSYKLQVVVEHSSKSQAHWHACIGETFKNLPDDLADKFPSQEHFRKWMLVQCGYATERVVACATMVEAHRVMALASQLDEYAVATRSGATVSIWTAKETKRMLKKEYQEMKDKTLTFMAGLLDVTPDELANHGATA